MATSPIDVLIVGAGPTGLTLGCVLAQRGVKVRIIDALDTPPTGSRGKGLQPRSLELFDDLQIVDRIVAHGTFRLPIRKYDAAGNSQVGDIYPQPTPRSDAPYLSSLITPQWRVEEALRARLKQFNAEVEFGVELTGLTQDPDGVTAQLQQASKQRTLRAQWLVGCDGGKSAVRHHTGISFLGETLETHRMLVADVHVDGLDRDHWHIWGGAEGFFALCPLPSTDVFQLQASIAPGQAGEPALDTLQRLLERRAHRADIHLSDPTWMSLWRANIRMVDHYRVGRAFLAGDAAHVHSPAGGQGMNTGIQDAYNLGWKLHAVLGGADASLLDSYEEERLPIAAWVLGVSTQIMSESVKEGTIAFRRDDKTLQLGLEYRSRSLSVDTRPDSPGLRAGDRAPDAPDLIGSHGTRRIFDLLRGPHLTLLGVGARWRPVIDHCNTRYRDQVAGYVITSTAGDHDYIDAAAHVQRCYAADTLFVIRPDNYVGMATTDADIGAITTYLDKVTCRNPK